jgi:O-antigen/teichoic acid export membrane protein
MQGAALGMSSEVGAISGARALGGLQGVLLLVRPFTMFVTAAIGASTSEVAHAIGDRRRIWRHAIFASGLCGAAAAVNGLVMIVLPAKIGTFLLGDSWHVTHPLLIAACAYIVATGLLTGPSAGVYGIRAMKEAMRLNVISMVLMLTGAGVGAAVDGTKGALWLVGLSQAIMMLAWWATFAAHMRTTAPAVRPATELEPPGLGADVQDAAGSVAAGSVAALATTGKAARTWLPADLVPPARPDDTSRSWVGTS